MQFVWAFSCWVVILWAWLGHCLLGFAGLRGAVLCGAHNGQAPWVWGHAGLACGVLHCVVPTMGRHHGCEGMMLAWHAGVLW